MSISILKHNSKKYYSDGKEIKQSPYILYFNVYKIRIRSDFEDELNKVYKEFEENKGSYYKQIEIRLIPRRNFESGCYNCSVCEKCHDCILDKKYKECENIEILRLQYINDESCKDLIDVEVNKDIFQIQFYSLLKIKEFIDKLINIYKSKSDDENIEIIPNILNYSKSIE